MSKSQVKVDDKAWKELRRHLKKLEREGAHVKVGVLASSGTHAESGISMIEIASVHEFGSPSIGVPERSFIRAGIQEKRDDLVRILNGLAKGIVQDKITVDEALQKLGLWGANAVKRKITSSDIPPPLKASTVARKGSTKPLVDTGQLVNSISFEVVP